MRFLGRFAPMIVQNLDAQTSFTTKDGSMIRSILDRTNAPVGHQSLAEATLPAGHRTTRHYHAASEEIYFILAGTGEMTVGQSRREVTPGDAILIPPRAWHTIEAREPLRFLCCCAPPYSDADTFFE
jgi:mannose-6-phosphate isomerase-like protein (cupin superfamily)